ncbi:hypothetical protein D3C75_831140 [compost metagenome]
MLGLLQENRAGFLVLVNKSLRAGDHKSRSNVLNVLGRTLQLKRLHLQVNLAVLGFHVGADPSDLPAIDHRRHQKHGNNGGEADPQAQLQGQPQSG